MPLEVCTSGKLIFNVEIIEPESWWNKERQKGLENFKEKGERKEDLKLGHLWVWGSLSMVEMKEVKTPQEARG